MRRIALTATALLASCAGAGCQTVGPAALNAVSRAESPSPGGSDYSYGGGRAVQTFVQAPAAVQPAVLAALEDLRVSSLRQISDGGSIVFEGTTADDRKATVTLRPEARGTHLTARVGLFGDRRSPEPSWTGSASAWATSPPPPFPSNPPSDPAPNPYFSRRAGFDAEVLRDQAESPYRATAVPDNKPY